MGQKEGTSRPSQEGVGIDPNRRTQGPSCRLCAGRAERFYTTPDATEVVLLCGACDAFITVSDPDGLIERLLALDGIQQTEGIKPITFKQREREVLAVLARCDRPHSSG